MKPPTLILPLVFAAAAMQCPAIPPQQVIVFTTWLDLELDTKGGIYVVNGNGTGFRQLTHFAHPDHELDDLHGLQLPEDHPIISPDGRKIAFTSNRFDPSNWDVYLMDINGGNPVRLTTTPGLDTEPSWSPDGTKLVFSTARFGNLDLAILTLASGAVTRLTSSPFEEVEPAWSPDGQRIAYTVAVAQGDKDIWLINADGTNNHQITFAEGEDHDASWKPDGTEIVITSERFKTPVANQPYGDVLVIAPNGVERRNLSDDQVFGSGDPSWSPDGSRIVFFHSHGPILHSPQQVFTMNASDGTQKTGFEMQALANIHPTWGLVPDTDGDGVLDCFELSNTDLNGGDFNDPPAAGDYFGAASAVADVNGDGVPELFIGVPGQSASGAPGSRHGLIKAVVGGQGGLDHMKGVRFRDIESVLPIEGISSARWGVPPVADGHFGQTMVSGDFDNSGTADLAVGAPGMGKVFITGPASHAFETLSGPVTFGSAVAAGDLNNDGRADLAVGAPGASSGGVACGSIRVFFGGPSGPLETSFSEFAENALPGGTRVAGDQFGWCVLCRHVTGDLAADLIIGVPGKDAGGANAGRIWVVPGKVGGTLQFTQAFTRDATFLPAPHTGHQAGARFGETLAAGRFNGNLSGIADLAVGSPRRNVGGVTEAGLVAVFAASATSGTTPGLTNAQVFTAASFGSPIASVGGQLFGSALTAGEVSGDSREDLAIAAPAPASVTTLPGRNGRVYLLMGQPPASTQPPPQTSCNQFGVCFSLNLPPVSGPAIGGGGGLSASSVQLLTAQTFGLSAQHTIGFFRHGAPTPSPFDGQPFGNILAIGNVNLDGSRDLLIGMPDSQVQNDGNGRLAIKFQQNVGVVTVQPADLSVLEPGKHMVQIAWAHPRRWLEIESVHFRLANDLGPFAWFRFDNTAGTLSLINESAGTATGGHPGDEVVMANDFVSLDLAACTLTTGVDGLRGVVLEFPLTLANVLRGQCVNFEMLATDTTGQSQGWDRIATWSIGPAAPHLTSENLIQFTTPTLNGQQHTLETLTDADWLPVRSFPGDGFPRLIREPAMGPNRFWRVR